MAVAGLGVAALLTVLAPPASAGTDLGVNTGTSIESGTYPSGGPVGGETVIPVITFFGPLTLDGSTVIASFEVTNVIIYYHGAGNQVALQGFAEGGPAFSGTCQASAYNNFSVIQPDVTLQWMIGVTSATTAVTINNYPAPIPLPNFSYPGVYTDQSTP